MTRTTRQHRSASSDKTLPATAKLSEYAFAVLLVIALIVIAATSKAPATAVHTTRTVHVSAGDTLWDIAKRNPVPKLNTARTVSAIIELNGLRTSAIVVGQSLMLPVNPDATAIALR